MVNALETAFKKKDTVGVACAICALFSKSFKSHTTALCEELLKNISLFTDIFWKLAVNPRKL